ncbi:tyrosine-type recombinase/integrase [Octadecabacter sp.]|nr:tyrosine-type recombinase/integrase [Octadecabacter sp.]
MGYILDTSQSPSSIPHTVIRGRTYYFQMRVPKQHQQLYGQSIRARLSECEEEARTLATHLSHLLKQSWQSNNKVKVCIDQALRSVRPAKVTFAAIAEEYITTRQVDHKSSMVAIRALLTVAGDRPVESYKRDDARALLAHLQSVGNKTATIRRRFNSISAILNFAYQELEIDKRNPFAQMTIVGEGLDAAKRGTFTEQELRDGYKQSMNSLTGIPLLFPILGETGCRLAEIVGLRVGDVDLDDRVLRIRPNNKRRLKTAGSERSLPLTHTASLALSMALEYADDEWMFPRYIKEDGCYATHASNALAKWTKRRWGLTAHSLRHTFRDRLRAAEVPLEAIDQIGGWSSVSSIGSSYGKGYTVDHLRRYMDQVAIT